MKYLTEALNLARIRSNFASFFKELNRDITNEVLFALSILSSKLLLEILKKVENDFDYSIDNLFEDAYYFADRKIDKSLLNSEFPTIYMEKLLSELKRIYSEYYTTGKVNVNDYQSTSSSGRFFEDILKMITVVSNSDYNFWSTHLNLPKRRAEIADVYIGYASLFIVKLFIKKYGLNFSVLNDLERKVYNRNYFVYDDLLQIFKKFAENREKKKKSQMRNRKVFENENIEVYKVDDSREACITLGKGTDWCVANTHTDSHYKEYSSMGDMYAFIFKNIKNKFDGQGPEKALLTIKNKGNSPNDINEEVYNILNILKSNDYKVKYKIKNFEDKTLDKEVMELADDQQFFETLKNTTNKLRDIRFRQILKRFFDNHIIDQFNNIFSTKTIETPFYLKNLGDIYKNESIYKNYLKNEMKRKIFDVYSEFVEAVFDFDSVKEKIENIEYFNLLKFIYELNDSKYGWLVETSKLKTAITISNKNEDIKIESDLNKLSNLIKKNVFKYEIILSDSNNDHIIDENGIPINSKLIKHIFEWPELSSKILNVDLEDYMILVDFFNNIETEEYVPKEFKNLISFIKELNSIIDIVQMKNNWIRLIKNNAKKSKLANQPLIGKFISNALASNNVVLLIPFFPINSIFDKLLNISNLHSIINTYFKIIAEYNEIFLFATSLKKIKSDFAKRSFNQWKQDGFFDTTITDDMISFYDKNLLYNQYTIYEIENEINLNSVFYTVFKEFVNYISNK